MQIVAEKGGSFLYFLYSSDQGSNPNQRDSARSCTLSSATNIAIKQIFIAVPAYGFGSMALLVPETSAPP